MPTLAKYSSLGLFKGWQVYCALGCFVVFWLTAAMELWEDRQSRIAEKTVDSKNLAAAFGQYTHERFRFIDLVLSGIARGFVVDWLADPAQAPGIYDLLLQQRAVSNGILQFQVLDADGIVRHSSETPDPLPATFSEPVSLERLREGQTGEPEIYRTTVGRYGSTISTQFITMAKRLERRDGSFGGIVTATFLADDLTELFRTIDLGANGSIGLIHSDGRLLLLGPNNSSEVDRNLIGAPEFSTMFANAEFGTFTEDIPIGSRLVSYRRIPGVPLISFVSMPVIEILTQWNEEMVRVLVTDGAMSLLVLTLIVVARRETLRRAADADRNALASLNREELLRLQSSQAQAARDQLAQVFASMSDGVAILDIDHRYIFVNDAFCRVCALPKEKFINHAMGDVLSGIKYEKYRPQIEAARNAPVGVSFDDRFVANDGSTRWVEILALWSSHNTSLFVRDVSQRRESERRLMEAQRMDAVGQLSGGLAHDFNNILAVVLGNVELLEEKAHAPDLLRYASVIGAAAVRGQDLISRLLSFARRQALRPVSIEPASLINDVCILVRGSMPGNVKIGFICNAGVWPIEADLAQLENALVNLCINGRDAMPSGGKLTIEASNFPADSASSQGLDAGDYVRLSVIDTGVGMTSDVLAKAFEPFFTTKSNGLGNGLGLSMVHGFVNQSGGGITISSIPEVGTTASLFLKRSTALVESQTSLAVTQEYTPRGGETILLVEDDQSLLTYLKESIAKLGYTTMAYGSAEAALAESARRPQPDLLLTDIMLAGPMGGIELGETMMQRGLVSRVIYMTGYAEGVSMRGGEAGKSLNLLLKPFTRHDLAVRIRKALDAIPGALTA